MNYKQKVYVSTVESTVYDQRPDGSRGNGTHGYGLKPKAVNKQFPNLSEMARYMSDEFGFSDDCESYDFKYFNEGRIYFRVPNLVQNSFKESYKARYKKSTEEDIVKYGLGRLWVDEFCIRIVTKDSF